MGLGRFGGQSVLEILYIIGVRKIKAEGTSERAGWEERRHLGVEGTLTLPSLTSIFGPCSSAFPFHGLLTG